MIVSFAVVAYNEAETLPRLLRDLAGQDYPHEKVEVLLIDSMSTDDTARIMEDFAAEGHGFLRVKVLKNPGKILPCGCNVMLENYTGDALVRLDGHATIPTDFISKNVAVLESGEDISAGPRPNIIDEATSWKETLLLAEQSMFGSSIAPYRHREKRSYVSSAFHAMYRREVYEAAGRYDQRLSRTEDNDMSWRIRAAGYRICYTPEITSCQHTRNTLKKLLRQKYLNGYWIGKTMGVNPHCFSIYHFVPLAFVLGILLTTVLAALGHPLLGGLMWGAYLLLILLFTVVELVRHPFSATNLLLPVIFFLLHISYGTGTLVGLVEMPFWLRKLKRLDKEGRHG